jgi:hypothetical protein
MEDENHGRQRWASVFGMGLKGAALFTLDSECGDELGNVRSALRVLELNFKHEIDPQAYHDLWETLKDLQLLKSTVPLSKTVLDLAYPITQQSDTMLSCAQARPNALKRRLSAACARLGLDDDKLEQLVMGILRWQELSSHFVEVLRGAVDKESPHYVWLQCGICFRRCLNQYEHGCMPSVALDELQRSISELPQAALDTAPVLGSFSEFEFDKLGVGEFVRSLPEHERARRGWDPSRPMHICSLVSWLLSEATILACTFAASKHDAQAVPMQPLPMMSAGHKEGENDAPATAKAAVTLPQLSWDSEKRAFLIDGKKFRKFPASLIEDSGYSRASFERNAWIYQQCMLGVVYEDICDQMTEKPKDWRRITSRQGVTRAAETFAVNLGLPLPPPRQPGRRRKSKLNAAHSGAAKR